MPKVISRLITVPTMELYLAWNTCGSAFDAYMIRDGMGNLEGRLGPLHFVASRVYAVAAPEASDGKHVTKEVQRSTTRVP